MLYHGFMTEQLSLMVLVVALATGLITSFVATTGKQAQQPEFFRYFLANILLFNLLILSGLVFRYLTIQNQGLALMQYPQGFLSLLAVMAALKLAWLFAFISMNMTLPGDIRSKRSAKMLVGAGAVVFFVYLGVMAAAWFMRHDGLQQAGFIALETLIVGGALLATTQLVFTASNLPKGSRRKSVLMFGAYHLVLLGIIFATLINGWLQPGPQGLLQLLANGGFLILFNVFSLVWIRWFQPLQPATSLEKFELFGITKREREIIGLIQVGKTNQEIADSLYISVATVKDHNHNLFRKSGVRNRLELANLFR